MNEDCLKLTTYSGERHRSGDAFVADALVDIYARRGFETSVVLRGAEGFGAKHHLRTDRLLTLSEDLPIVTVAVDTRPRIETAADEIAALMTQGVVTLERARLLTSGLEATAVPEELGEEAKLTVYVGRHDRPDGRPAHLGIVDLLHRHGVAGASVLLGVDGTAHGVRRRAAFFGRNADVPLMIICVGAGDRIAAALPDLARVLARPLATLERVQVCKRDGRLLAQPRAVGVTTEPGLAMWQKLMIYAGEQARTPGGDPLHRTLVRRLRSAGALGATSLRGVWGYHGEHAPHGDRFFALRRHVPMVSVVIDTPLRTRDHFAIVDELTGRTGLVTSEVVPAFRPGSGAL